MHKILIYCIVVPGTSLNIEDSIFMLNILEACLVTWENISYHLQRWHKVFIFHKTTLFDFDHLLHPPIIWSIIGSIAMLSWNPPLEGGSRQRVRVFTYACFLCKMTCYYYDDDQRGDFLALGFTVSLMVHPIITLEFVCIEYFQPIVWEHYASWVVCTCSRCSPLKEASSLGGFLNSLETHLGLNIDYDQLKN